MADEKSLKQLLLEAARAALSDRSTIPSAGRARAAAAMVRTALEREIDERLLAASHQRGAGTGSDRARWRSKLIALRVLDGTNSSTEIVWVWNALSSACHHHAYNLTPSVSEVEHLVSLVERLLAPTESAADPEPADRRPLDRAKR